MAAGYFEAQIRRGWEILSELELSGEYVPRPSYPSSPRAFFKDKSYLEVWKSCLQNRFYHYQFIDSSLVYFGFGEKEAVSFSFYEFPFLAKTYSQFVVDHGFALQEAGEDLRDDYEMYLSTCELKESISSVRYDLSYEQYIEGRHPASHLHVGHLSNIRIGTRHILEPLSFLFFILRQNYPEKWVEFAGTNPHDQTKNVVRTNLSQVKTDYFNRMDECELYLT